MTRYLSILCCSGIVFAISGCMTHTSATSNQNSKRPIDYAAYLPQKSMIKKYVNRSHPVPSGGVKIIRKGKQLTYVHNLIGASDGAISYSVELEIDKEYIFEYTNTFKRKQTKRMVAVGDVTSSTTYNKYAQERCILKERLNVFSHEGYHFRGDIIHERCKSSYLSKKATDIYDRYSQKGLGMIAIVNDSCFQGSNRYPTDIAGCKPNRHRYRVYANGSE